MKTVPRTSAQLKAALASLFPTLPRDFGAWGESVLEDAGPTYHSLMREFALYFERNVHQLPDRQLRRFAELVARCLAEGGPLADAMRECLVEPLRRQGSRFDALLAGAMER